MSSLNLTTSVPVYGNSYAENLGIAARNFLAALLAVKPAAPIAAPVVRQQTDRQRVKAVLELHRLASRYDSIMPSQAAELRLLAEQC